MNIQGQIDALMEAISNGTPMHVLMRAEEEKLGNRVVVPGDEPWLSPDDWHSTVVVSVDDRARDVRLIAILALDPGTGALRRTVAGIKAAGLTPCIIAPTHEMRATCKRWGWVRTNVGRGWNHEEQWRPHALALGVEPTCGER